MSSTRLSSLLFAIRACAVCALVAVPWAAQAQGLTYRCTAKDGKKYYGSTIPPQCYGRAVEQLNKYGTVVKRIDPEADEKEREEKEAALAKKKEDDAANREESRRNRALLATYTSERDIESARSRALADNQRAIRDVEHKIDEIKKRRAKYDTELDFYKDKQGNSKPPAKLAEDIKNTEIDLRAQEVLLAAKRKEDEQINAKYDEDKKRYLQLTRGGGAK